MNNKEKSYGFDGVKKFFPKDIVGRREQNDVSFSRMSMEDVILNAKYQARKFKKNGRVAQWLEHLSDTQKVLSSSLNMSTI